MASTIPPGYDGEDGVVSSTGENFLLAEDEALKNYLKGMSVSDDKNTNREVHVWFAMPDMEVRDQKFPFIVLELIQVIEAKDREKRGLLKVVNAPGSLTTYDSGNFRYAEEPLPINLVYQASAYSRHPRHNRQIISQMLAQRVPGRLAGLPVASDGSKRHMELLQWTSRDTIDGGRKLWQTAFTILVSSEISDLMTTPQTVPVSARPILTITEIAAPAKTSNP